MTFVDVTAQVLLLCVKQNFTGSLIFAAQGGYICNYFCCKISPHLQTGWGARAPKNGIGKNPTHSQHSGVTQRKLRVSIEQALPSQTVLSALKQVSTCMLVARIDDYWICSGVTFVQEGIDEGKKLNKEEDGKWRWKMPRNNQINNWTRQWVCWFYGLQENYNKWWKVVSPGMDIIMTITGQ